MCGHQDEWMYTTRSGLQGFVGRCMVHHLHLVLLHYDTGHMCGYVLEIKPSWTAVYYHEQLQTGLFDLVAQ